MKQNQGIGALKLPLQVDLEGLLSDLKTCQQLNWSAHYNTRDYEGDWESIALRSHDGKSTTVFAHPSETYHDTDLLAQCPHFKSLIDSLQCDKEVVRLLRQAAGGEIKTHRDMGLGYPDGTFRLHVPLLTNAEVDFVVDGKRLPMQPGECWFADFSLPHSVHNRGKTDRVHLVIDCTRNAWTDGWFERAGVDPKTLAAKKIPVNQRLQTIAELRRMNNPALARLIAELEEEEGIPQRKKKPTPKASKYRSGSAHSHRQPSPDINATQPQDLSRILNWLDEIGIGWEEGVVPEGTFLPGLEVVAGRIVIDRKAMLSPGDILHEAGHVALLPAEKRAGFNGNLAAVYPEHQGDEVAVILWTYAAGLHLGLPMEDVIHDQGYHGQADWLRSEFAAGTFIGLPLLVWMGLCDDPKVAGEMGFPRMKRWVR
ncbi:MAG: aspartyl/asparaginyl beta-hydroxylase domain-containing protein [Bacteroidia bacterium]